MADFPSPSSAKVSVLFVCLGNICRSPMAEAVFRSLTNNLPPAPSSKHIETALPAPHPLILDIDSAGTGAWHVLEPPDPRTHATLLSHNVRGYKHGARKITAHDFEHFDYILAMDKNNLRDLQAVRIKLEKEGLPTKADVRLFGESWAKPISGEGEKDDDFGGEEVVDPYYGADNGFEIVYEQVERFSKAFLQEIERRKDNQAGEVDVEGS